MASAEYPLAASRPATERMWSLSPRFSWMTSTLPLGLAAAAQAPWRVRPCGPLNVTAWVASGAGPAGFDGSADVGCAGGAGFVSSFEPQAARSVVAAAPAMPSRPSRRSASRLVMMPSA